MTSLGLVLTQGMHSPLPDVTGGSGQPTARWPCLGMARDHGGGWGTVSTSRESSHGSRHISRHMGTEGRIKRHVNSCQEYPLETVPDRLADGQRSPRISYQQAWLVQTGWLGDCIRQMAWQRSQLWGLSAVTFPCQEPQRQINVIVSSYSTAGLAATAKVTFPRSACRPPSRLPTSQHPACTVWEDSLRHTR